jgi:hypothetical protein
MSADNETLNQAISNTLFTGKFSASQQASLTMAALVRMKNHRDLTDEQRQKMRELLTQFDEIAVHLVTADST